MNEAELRQRLAELHQELETSPEVSEETSGLLRAITDDIHQMLDRPEPATHERHQSFVERLRAASWDLEASHAKLTTAVSQLVDALTRPFQ